MNLKPAVRCRMSLLGVLCLGVAPVLARCFGCPEGAPVGSYKSVSATAIQALLPRETASAVVTTTADTVADDGQISLREAIIFANANPGATITFNIPASQAAGGVFSIQPTSALPTITATGTILDGTSQTTFGGDTNTAGPEIAINGAQAGGSTGQNGVHGLVLQAANCTIKGVAVSGFTGSGILLTGAAAASNRIQGCYVGLDPNGVAAVSNGNSGITIQAGAHGNTIGGTTAAERNVVAGNVTDVYLRDAGTSNNVVEGNYIGIRADGTAAPSNEPGQTSGLLIKNGATSNTIGGTTTGAGNVITGYGTGAPDSGSGLAIWDAGTESNVVQGNYIGTDATGTIKLGTSTYGAIVTSGAQHNTIGGAAPGARNVVALHDQFGIAMTFADHTTVQGNYVGIDPNGAQAIGTGLYGVLVYASSSCLVGGTAAGAGNVIAGNAEIGVWIAMDPGVADPTNNVVQGNLIGCNPAGTAAVGHQSTGIAFNGSGHDNVIGLALDGSGKGNVIAFNGGGSAEQDGIRVALGTNSTTPRGNVIRGNSIFNNGGLGINLQPDGEAAGAITPNDNQDADDGPNRLQNFPSITTATGGAATTISGTLNSTPNTVFIIDLYSNDSKDASGNGEGQTYLGSTNVTTSSSGDATFGFNAATDLSNKFVSATATNNATGDTSEFGPSVQVTGGTPSGFSISGHIALGDGTALANVSVARSGGNAVTTDGSGNYSFTNVAAGTYTITPTLNGYTFAPVNRSVTINAANVTGQDFTATLVPTTFSISGHIAKSDGTAVANVSVTRSGSSTPVTTDGNGNYSFTNVPAGTYTITPSLASYTFSPANRSVAVTNANVTGQDFTANPVVSTFTISGRIATASNVAAANVTISRSGSTTSVTTDSNGNYSFSGVPAGTYTITPQSTAYSFSPLNRSVTVINANVTGQNFIATVIPTTFAISGSVSIDGAALANVTITRSGSSTPVTTDVQGLYSFANVPAGNYTITPSRAGYTFTPTSRTVTVTNANVTGQNFTATQLSTTFSISGRISLSNGIALPNVKVTRLDTNSSIYTNSAGYYTFINLAPGSYTVTPTLNGYTFSPTSRTISVTNANVSGQYFIGTARTSFNISGQIVSTTGTPLARVTVTRTGSSSAVQTNTSGIFTFANVPAGTYSLTAGAAGYSFTPSVRTVTVTNTDVTGQNFTGAATTSAATYRIIGRLATSKGVAIANVSVTRTGSSTTVLTNSAGYYVFTGVPNGSYTVRPTSTAYIYTPAYRTVAVNGADALGQNFTAATAPSTGPFTISGRISNSNGTALVNVRVLRSGSTTPVYTNSSGYYTFTNVVNGLYSIVPDATGVTFTPSFKSVTVNGANVSGQNFIGQ